MYCPNEKRYLITLIAKIWFLFNPIYVPLAQYLNIASPLGNQSVNLGYNGKTGTPLRASIIFFVSFARLCTQFRASNSCSETEVNHYLSENTFNLSFKKLFFIFFCYWICFKNVLHLTNIVIIFSLQMLCMDAQILNRCTERNSFVLFTISFYYILM